jgi:hypothetical protein
MLKFRLMKHRKSTSGQTLSAPKMNSSNSPFLFFPVSVILTLLINLLFVVSVFSQTITVNNVSVHNTVEITVNGSMEMNGTTVINNQDVITVSGDLTNNASYNVFGNSQGTVELNGNLQVINGTDSILFHHLLLNSAGQKLMQVAIATGGSSGTGLLTLNNGILDLNQHRLHVLNTSPAAIVAVNGGLQSEAADFSAMVSWNTGTAAAAYSIPFVNAGGQPVPFIYDITSGAAGKILVATYATGTNNTPLPVNPVAVSSLTTLANGDPQQMVDRFWYASTQLPVTADITFGFDPATESASGSGPVLAQVYNSDSSAWLPPVPAQLNPQPGRVILPATSSAGIFGLGVGASPLPIELLEFKARKSGDDVICSWITLSEKNNDYFTVERSKDGFHFEAIGTVQGAGTTTAMSYYAFTDYEPLSGLSYYRLKQTDFDGQYAYSQIESVRFGESDQNDLSLQIFPNPADQFTNILVTLPEDETGSMTVTDAAGRTIATYPLNINEPAIMLQLSEFNPGIYFINVSAGQVSKTSRLIVTH